MDEVFCEKCIHAEVCDKSSRLIWARLSKEKICTDFMELVRCKDCKYFIPKVDGTVGFCKCGEVCGYCTSMRVADDFCSYGERSAPDGS